MGKFILQCVGCGREYAEWRLVCANTCDALLRTRYREKDFLPSTEKSIFRYLDWLPCGRAVKSVIGPVVFKSEAFAKRIGVRELYCAFNGYWPDRGAYNATGTFKDYEAWAVLAQCAENGTRTLILASAGNTGRAFAHAAEAFGIDVYIVIPEQLLTSIWTPAVGRAGRVRVIAVKNSRDYYRAITLCAEIAREYAIPLAGGVRNAAARDGMATVMLEAARVIGRMPQHYFQAVGSGTGAIASYEAAVRLLESGRYPGQRLPQFNLAQNEPFAPMYWAWRDKKAIEADADCNRQNSCIERAYAAVLTNRSPAYSVRGGVADMLQDTGGRMYAVSNEDAQEAADLFERCEGVDVDPASGVCLASLAQAAREGSIRGEDAVLVNITGGGFENIRSDFYCARLPADVVINDLESGRKGLLKIL